MFTFATNMCTGIQFAVMPTENEKRRKKAVFGPHTHTQKMLYMDKLSCTNCGELKAKCRKTRPTNRRNIAKAKQTNQSVPNRFFLYLARPFGGRQSASVWAGSRQMDAIFKFMIFNSLIKICYLICVALCELKWNLFIDDHRGNDGDGVRASATATHTHNIFLSI